MKAISFLTKRVPRRTRFGYPLGARFADFDRGVFRKSTMNAGQSSSFHFASSEYERCFRDLPKPDVGFLKETSVAFLDAFDKKLWYEDPVSIVTIDVHSTIVVLVLTVLDFRVPSFKRFLIFDLHGFYFLPKCRNRFLRS